MRSWKDYTAQRVILSANLFVLAKTIPSNNKCALFKKIKSCVNLTLMLPGEGQMALPLNVNDKNIPNADVFLVF